MRETWRWYGALDKIDLGEISQTGASGIVTALHEIPYGHIWDRSTIAERHNRIRAAGLAWSVVESLPVHEDIKRGTGDLPLLFANYRQSMANLAAEGVHTICYNFMPLLDWTRTDLNTPIKGGGTCLRFDASRMAAFEIYMLGRDAAEQDYPEEVLYKAKKWFAQSNNQSRSTLLKAIMSGLPGAYDRYDLDGLSDALRSYDGLSSDDVRFNFKRFLSEVIPTAEDLGIRLCVHPDDPPRDILGLPRIVSDAADIDWIMTAVPSLANGLTLCSGSLGANPANDVSQISRRHADRIHFAHLRNVHKDSDGSFQEAAHLEGDTDIVALASVLLEEESRRSQDGRADCVIPFRPDHGHELLSDNIRDTFPGYPLIGRLRGLAEIRGVLHALSKSSQP
mgnify:CR=1 FL=1